MSDMWTDAENDPRTYGNPVGELATYREYLDNYRLTIRLKCEGLDPEQLARRSVPPSSLSLLGLVRHLAQMENHWFQRVLQGRTVAPRLYNERTIRTRTSAVQRRSRRSSRTRSRRGRRRSRRRTTGSTHTPTRGWAMRSPSKEAQSRRGTSSSMSSRSTHDMPDMQTCSASASTDVLDSSPVGTHAQPVAPPSTIVRAVSTTSTARSATIQRSKVG